MTHQEKYGFHPQMLPSLRLRNYSILVCFNRWKRSDFMKKWQVRDDRPMGTARLALGWLLVLSTVSQNRLHAMASLSSGPEASPWKDCHTLPRNQSLQVETVLFYFHTFFPSMKGLLKLRFNPEKKRPNYQPFISGHNPCTSHRGGWRERFDFPKMALPSLESILEVTGAMCGESPVK